MIQWEPNRKILSLPFSTLKVDEYLSPPEVLNRGKITTTDILNVSDEATCKEMIESWAHEVYKTWSSHHQTVDFIASKFMQSK